VDDDAILEQYGEAIRRFCRRRTWSAGDAEDAVQTTYLRWLGRKDREVPNPEAWLLQAAKWACANVAARKLRERAREAPELPKWPKTGASRHDPQAIDPATQVTEAAVVHTMLRRLTERDHIIIAQVYFHGATISELGRRLRCTPAYAAVLTQRARQRARAVLAELGEHGLH